MVSFLEMSSAEIQQGTNHEDIPPVPDNHRGMNFEHLLTERFVFVSLRMLCGFGGDVFIVLNLVPNRDEKRSFLN